MWNYQTLSRIDIRVIFVILALQFIGILVISSYSVEPSPEAYEETFFTPVVRHQLQFIAIGWVVFFFVAGFDYNKLREWTWLFYALMIVSLVGLFFTDAIQRVHRWYRIPILGIGFQPSEYAKLVVVIALSWFLERRRSQANAWSTAFFGGLIAGIPFILILKQPDLGTALVLFPITLVMFYFGDIRPSIVKAMTWAGGLTLVFVALIFLGLLPHEEVRPYARLFLKDYQFDRLDPNTHHQKAAVTAIALGGLTGKGWRKSEYTGGGWLPTPYTDSVFPAFGEEFGFIGLLLLLVLFYALIYFSFQVTAVAGDPFGRLLSAGVTVYLAMHILVNIGMMTGMLPITGVPLVLVSYGGTSILSTMTRVGHIAEYLLPEVHVLMSHDFIFHPGKWIGEGRIAFSASPETIRFFTKWIIDDTQPDGIECTQEVEMQGTEPSMKNTFHFYQITPGGFSVELENEIIGKVKGNGVIDPKTIAWEFHSTAEGLEGFEVYELQDNGDYMLHAEYSSPDQFRTIIDGRIWRKSE